MLEPGKNSYRSFFSLNKLKKSKGISKIKIEKNNNEIIINTKNRVLKLKPIINEKAIIRLMIEFLELVKTAANVIAKVKNK